MNYKRTILKNGLRVITVPMKDNPTVTVLVLVEAGSEYENKENNGISHFLEHMCFKGTVKRPKASDLSRELDTLGAQYNAFTSQEYTGYYAKAEAEYLTKILDIVSDMYLHPVFEEKEIEKEKGVIIEEINMYEDLPQRKVDEVFNELLYGDQPAGWSIAGKKENIRKMKRVDFLKYRTENYVPSATTVVVAGKIKEKEILAKVAKAFAKMPVVSKGERAMTKESQTKPASRVFAKKTDQAHIMIGFRTFDTYNKNNAILKVMSSVLGGGMSSRLFQKLRDEMGVCYYVHLSNDTLIDRGVLSVGAGLDKSRVKEATEAVLVELLKLKKELVPKAELDKAKKHLLGGLALGLESSDDLAEFYGGQEVLHKKLKMPADLRKEILKVKAEDIKRLAAEIFQKEKLNIAMVGEGEEKVFEDIFAKL